MILAHQRKMLGSARLVTPGSVSYTTPGSYLLLVPEYNTLTVDFKGAGGGGGVSTIGYTSPSAGTLTGIVAMGLYAGGGAAGNPYNQSTGSPGAAGANGAGVGGTTNTTGGGSPGGTPVPGLNAGRGGYGGRTQQSFNYGDPGAPLPGTYITIVVGTAGIAGHHVSQTNVTSQPGQPGSASLSWN